MLLKKTVSFQQNCFVGNYNKTKQKRKTKKYNKRIRINKKEQKNI